MHPIKHEIGGRPYPKDIERQIRVKVELAKRNMTISDLAKVIGIQSSHVSEVISGRRLSPKTEERIAAYFDMAREALFPLRTIGERAAMRKAETNRESVA